MITVSRRDYIFSQRSQFSPSFKKLNIASWHMVPSIAKYLVIVFGSVTLKPFNTFGSIYRSPANDNLSCVLFLHNRVFQAHQVFFIILMNYSFKRAASCQIPSKLNLLLLRKLLEVVTSNDVHN